MHWVALVVMGLVAIVAGFIISGRRIYRPLFAPEHFEEVAQLLVTLRESALEELDAGPSSLDSNPPAAVTSAGLALSYTIERHGDHFIHHLAISLPGHTTPHAVGDRFALFVANRLGVSTDRVSLGAARSTVRHMEFDVDENEHRDLAVHPIRAPTDGEREDLRNEFNTRPLVCRPIDLPRAT